MHILEQHIMCDIPAPNCVFFYYYPHYGTLASRLYDLRIFSRHVLYFGGFQKLTCTTFKVKGMWKVIYATSKSKRLRCNARETTERKKKP